MKDKEEFSRKDPDASHKVYWLAIIRWIVPISCILIGLYLTTQRFAPLMNFDENVIGKPLFIRKDGYKIYNPLIFILGMFKYAFNDTYSYYFFKVIPPTLIGIFTAIMTFFIISVIVMSHQKNQHIHGTARWADVKDLEKFGLIDNKGIVCGELNSAEVLYKMEKDENGTLKLHLSLKHYFFRERVFHLYPKIAPLVCVSGATNILAIAPTRMGKGVNNIIPTLLLYGVPFWAYIYKKTSIFYKIADGKLKFLCRQERILVGKGSMVVFDPKAENFEASAGYRSQFSTILPFNPMQIKDSHEREIGTVHYNPIHEIPDDEMTAFSWADMFGEFFFAEGSQGDNAYFYENARDIFNAVVLHVRFSPDIPWEKKTFTTVLKKFSMANDGDDEDEEGESKGPGFALIDEMKNTVHVFDNGEPFLRIHDLIVDAANRSKSQNPKERASMFSTVFSKMKDFQDPLIEEATSTCDFSVRDFINSKNGITLYLIIPYNHLKRIRPLFRLIVNFLIRNFSEGATNANSQKLKIPCLFLLDEFPALGKFEEIEENAGVLAGYGVTFMIICQSLSQIVKIYGENHAFLDHCKTVCLFTPGKIQDAKAFSEAMGSRSVLLDNISTSGNKFEAGWNNVSRSSQETQTSLINPDELMKLELNRVIIMNQGMPPYKAKKVVYYEDPRFKDKAFMKYPSIDKVIKRAKTLPSNNRLINLKKEPNTIEESINVIKSTEIKFIKANYDIFE